MITAAISSGSPSLPRTTTPFASINLSQGYAGVPSRRPGLIGGSGALPPRWLTRLRETAYQSGSPEPSRSSTPSALAGQGEVSPAHASRPIRWRSDNPLVTQSAFPS